MSPRLRTGLLAAAILAAGAIIGAVCATAWQEAERRRAADPERWPERLAAMIRRESGATREALRQAAPAFAAAADALREARREDEARTDAILARLAADLSEALKPAQRRELERVLAERTARWQQRLRP